MKKNNKEVAETTEEQILSDKEKTISLFKRDKFGLLPNIEYVFNSNGTINWRAMVGKEYLVANKDAIKSQNKEVDVSTLPDNQLLILLAGIKDLAQIRGFKSVSYDVVEANHNYVAVKCTINWTPNYETEMEQVSFSALADAHIENTKSFAKDFLMAIAENRAFVRAVRNFLRINIVGTDEMGDTSKGQAPQEIADFSPVSSTHPANVLLELMKKTNISFDRIKETLKKEGELEAENWSTTSDIPNKTIFQLIQRLKKKT